ncbi:UNVERIFIED_CONTAM: hypothetical protein HDU68_003437 [Siphonaria sp. JEL0065]|nr:hypothetical protein HDU68_003437 [Siphonaria sp. JEL0065]
MDDGDTTGGNYDANFTPWVAATPEAIVKTQTANGSNPIDSSTVATQAWLVKVPKFVKEHWDKVGDKPGVQLGTLRVYHPKPGRVSKTPQISLHLPHNPLPGLSDFWTDGVPKNFNLNITNTDVKSSYVFTTNEQQDSVGSFSATVVHEATVTPVIDAEYKALSKKRQEDESKKRKNVETIDLVTAKKAMRVGHSNVAHVHDSIIKPAATSVAAVTGKSAQQEKRERMERSDLISYVLMQGGSEPSRASVIYARGSSLSTIIILFNEHAYWKFSDLIEKTQQPQAWLKQVLNDVAEIVKTGPYHGLYELKKEYQNVGNGDDDDE